MPDWIDALVIPGVVLMGSFVAILSWSATEEVMRRAAKR